MSKPEPGRGFPKPCHPPWIILNLRLTTEYMGESPRSYLTGQWDRSSVKPGGKPGTASGPKTALSLTPVFLPGSTPYQKLETMCLVGICIEEFFFIYPVFVDSFFPLGGCNPACKRLCSTIVYVMQFGIDGNDTVLIE